jgi:phage gpG-like protein
MIGDITITKIYDTVTPALHNIVWAFGDQGRRLLLISTARKFIEETKSNFGKTGKYRDKEWPALSAAYAKKVGRRTATLKKTGALMSSIKMNSPRKNFVEIYTNIPYAAANVFGSKKQNIPARNFWPVQFTQPSYSRLLFNAEKDMIVEIGKRLNVLSSGVLPRLSSNIVRSQLQYGNPFTSPCSG